MSEDKKIQDRAIVPALRYRDVPGAIDWLCETFGFSLQSQSKDADGQIFLANLEFGNSTLIIGSVSDTEFDKLMVQPDQIEGAETQICSLLLEDVAAVFERACQADARILTSLEDNYAGGMHFTCCDPEGHVWHVDSSPQRDVTTDTAPSAALANEIPETYERVAAAYDEHQTLAETSGGIAPLIGQMSTAGIGLSAAAVIAAICGSLFLAFQLGAGSQEADQLQFTAMKTELAEASAQRLTAQESIRDVQARLADMKTGKQAAERSVQDVREKLTVVRSELEAANNAAEVARQELAQERATHDELARSGAKASDGVVLARRELADVRKDLELAQASIASTQLELKEARATGDTLTQSKAAIKEELTETRAKLASTQADVGKAQNTIASLRAEMGQQNALRNADVLATSGLKDQFAQLQDEAKTAALDATQAQRKLKEVNGVNQGLEQQVSAIRLELDQVRTARQNDVETGKKMEKKLASLKGELSAAEHTAQNLNGTLESERKASEKLRVELETAQQELQQERATRASGTQAEAASKKQLVALTAELRDAKRDGQITRSTLDAVRISNEDLTEKFHKSQTELANLRRQHEASLVAISSLRETLSQERAAQLLAKKTATGSVSVAKLTPPRENGSGSAASGNNGEGVASAAQNVAKSDKKSAPAVQVAAVDKASATGAPREVEVKRSLPSSNTPPIPERKTSASSSAALPDGSDVVGDDTEAVNKEQDNKRSGPTKQEVRIVQRELSRLGCFNGAADGQWTEAAENALGKFIRQSRRGLPKRMKAGRAIRALRASRGKVCR